MGKRGFPMRTNPHILEINAQVWLNKFSRELNKKITLADIPQSYLEEIKYFGFDSPRNRPRRIAHAPPYRS